jgi:hypothetical protein
MGVISTSKTARDGSPTRKRSSKREAREQRQTLLSFTESLLAGTCCDREHGDEWTTVRAHEAARRVEARGARYRDLQGLMLSACRCGWLLARSEKDLAWMMDVRAVTLGRLRDLAAEPGSGIAEVLRLPDVERLAEHESRKPPTPWIGVRVRMPDEPTPRTGADSRLPPALRKKHTASTWWLPGDWPPPAPDTRRGAVLAR